MNNIPNGHQSQLDYYEGITEDTIEAWQKILFESKLPNRIFNLCDGDIFNVDLSHLEYLRIVNNDMERTRVKEREAMPSFKEYGVLFIAYYCKDNGIDYKQGLNEIAGPLILLKQRVSISFANLYRIFVCLIDKYLTNYYSESELYSLQSSLSLVTILLKYHDPEVFNVFEYNLITSDMYATSWIMTLFANKLPLNVVYHLWNKLLIWNDSLFLHFLMVAVIIKNRELILRTHSSAIPAILCQLKIRTSEEVDELVDMAIDLSDKTPRSFRLLANKLEIFTYRSTKLKELYTGYDPDNILSMPIFPSEILSLIYKNSIGCPDQSCINYNIQGKIRDSKAKCLFCQSMQFEQNQKINYIILDLRINNSKKDTIDKDTELTFPGYLPMTVAMSNKQLLSPDFPNNLIESFSKDVSKYHFLLITSQTDYFKEYETKFYKEKITEKEFKNHQLGLVTKVNKELNLKLVNSHIERDKSNKLSLQIKEFDNFKKAIAKLLKEKFPYMSYIYGGFTAIHEECMSQKIQLLDHGPQCHLCRKAKEEKGFLYSVKNLFGRKRSSSRKLFLFDNNNSNALSLAHQSELDLDEITELLSNPNITQYACILKSNDGKEDQLMMFLIENIITIYKEAINNDQLTYCLIKKIDFDAVINIYQENTAGNILTIEYSVANDTCGSSSSSDINCNDNGDSSSYYKVDKENITIDFASNIDARDLRRRVWGTKYKRKLTFEYDK